MANEGRPVELFTRVMFSAAHSYRDKALSDAENFAKYGKYSRVHGHNYELIVGLRGRVDSHSGMLVNFFDVERILKEKVLDELDYSHLEADISCFREQLPSTENLARYIFNKLSQQFGTDAELFHIEVKESADLSATYTKD